jgi:hypothetical protein
VAVTAGLDALGIHARGRALRGPGYGIAVATLIIDVFKIECVDVTWEVAASNTSEAGSCGT